MGDSHSLTSQDAPDADTLWRALRQLVERVGAALEGDAAIDDCLDWTVEILGADRGLLVLQEDDGATRIVHARGRRKKLSPTEQEEASRTVVRRALETQSVVVWQKADGPFDSESVDALDLHAALAAPLRGRGVPRGVIYLDFRHPLRHVQTAHQEFFMAAVVLIGGMLEQNVAARAAKDRLREAQTHLTEARQAPSLDDLLGSTNLASVRSEVALALAGTSPVLILGESGSGKTLLAHALAEACGRKPIVRVVLGASDDLNTIASELFGHVRGAFSGATANRIGLVEYADGGTLVLDEVLNLSSHAQRLLLDFTQFGTYRPLGYDKAAPKHANVRIIAATNGNLQSAMQQGRFREDLYYRLAGVTIRMPSLRERRGDVAALAERVVRRLDPSRSWTLALDTRRRLASGVYEWAGNIRELEWVVRRARDRAVARDRLASEIRAEDLGDANERHAASVSPLQSPGEETAATEWKRLQHLKAQIEQREAELLRGCLERHGGIVAHAAKELGVARTTLAGRVQGLRPTAKE
jgi:transcriptional regulator with GAF, ATPase, and Fis domain